MTDGLSLYSSADTWPRFLGDPPVSGTIRQTPADFQVEELLGFEPDGEGEHVWLLIEKTGLTTVAVQQALSRHYGIAPRDIAYSGLKDKYAITRQWFSARTGMKTLPDLPLDLPAGISCLQAVKNSRKLRRGAHKSNRFKLIIRNVSGNTDELMKRLDSVRMRGVPNYFGPQRFGHDGANVIKLLESWRSGKRLKKQDEHSILLSAGRSFLFNRVLAARVEQADWDQVLEGDCFALAGSASTFAYAKAAPEELHRRMLEGDIHPTGPLWGAGANRVTGAALALEIAFVQEYEELAKGLEKHGLINERRPLRLAVEQLKYVLEGSSLVLQFELISGSFATAVLRELISYTEITNGAP